MVIISLTNSSASGLLTLKDNFFQCYYTNSYGNYQSDRQTAITRKKAWKSLKKLGKLEFSLKSISNLCLFPLSGDQTAVASWVPELMKTEGNRPWWNHMELTEHLTDVSKKGRCILTASRCDIKVSIILKKKKGRERGGERGGFKSGNLRFLFPLRPFFYFLYNHIFKIISKSLQKKFIIVLPMSKTLFEKLFMVRWTNHLKK